MHLPLLAPAFRHWLSLAVLLVTTGTSVAQETSVPAPNLDKCVGQFADKIKDFLQGKGQNNVIMGTITAGDPSQLATGGTLIRAKLMEKLKAHGIESAKVSKFGIKGEFVGEPQNNNPGMAVSINLKVTEGGKTGATFSDTVYDVVDMAKLLGGTVDLPIVGKDAPQQDQTGKPVSVAGPADPAKAALENQKRIDTLKEGLTKPTTELVSTTAFASGKSPFGVEIMVRSPDGQLIPRTPTIEQGLAFVDLQAGEQYAIKLTNQSTFDAGASISIDGLSSFHFSNNPSYKQLDKWVIGKLSTGVIQGWHLTDYGPADPLAKHKVKLAAFEVTKFGEEPASKLDKPEAIGAITVTFCAAWDPKGSPPPDELVAVAGTRGTKTGQEFDTELREVVRVFGKARAVVTIRYQQPENLPPGR